MAYRLVMILSGCGMYDGTDPHEAVLGQYFAEKNGFEVVPVAPAGPGLHVMNHTSGEAMSETGLDLQEQSARLVKGRLLEISTVPARFVDALFIPGGQGVIKNLLGGLGGEAHAPTINLIREVAALKRPILAVSLAELLVNRATGEPLGKGCFDFPPDAVYEEEGRNIFLTPGFTAATSIAQVAAGIEQMMELGRKAMLKGGSVLPIA